MRRITVVLERGLEIEWPQSGDTIQAPSLDGKGEPYMVMGPCGQGGHVFYCVRCRAGLANVGQLEMHVEHGGIHVIVVWCDRRRVYEPADPSVLDVARFSTSDEAFDRNLDAVKVLSGLVRP
jgi:hypothetical protein